MTVVNTLLDGRRTTVIPVDDRGLQYGDGLFETCVLRRGHLELWERHRQRLLDGCRRLAIPPPKAALLDRELAALCGGTQDGLVKLIVTRGSGGRGYRPPVPARSRRLWQLFPLVDYPEEYAMHGVRVQLCRTRLGHNAALAGIKHLSRLEQVLARSEWDAPSIREGLLQDQGGYWVEGCMSNLFLVSEGCLLTPALTRCGVAGVMRGLLLELAAELSIPVELRDIDDATLAAADELFLSNSVIRLWPVVATGMRRYVVGDISRRLAAAVAAHLDGPQDQPGH